MRTPIPLPMRYLWLMAVLIGALTPATLFAQAAISPAASIARKRTPQSTNPDAVAAALEELQQWLSGSTART